MPSFYLFWYPVGVQHPSHLCLDHFYFCAHMCMYVHTQTSVWELDTAFNLFFSKPKMQEIGKGRAKFGLSTATAEMSQSVLQRSMVLALNQSTIPNGNVPWLCKAQN